MTFVTEIIIEYNSVVGLGGVWVQLVGGQGAHARVILVLRECRSIWNAPGVSLVLLTFNDTVSLGSPPRQVVYPLGSTLSDCLPFPCRK